MAGKSKGFREFSKHEAELVEAKRPARKPSARAAAAAPKTIREAAETAPAAEAAAKATTQRGVDAMKTLTEQAAETARRGTEAAQDTVAQAASASEDALRKGGDAIRQATEAGTQAARQGAETLRQGAEAATRSSWQVVEGVARQAAQIGRSATDVAGTYQEAARSITPDLRVFAEMPKVALDGVQELRDAWSEWATRTTRNNALATQNLLRCTSMQQVAEVQSTFLKEHVQTMLEGSAELLRITTRLSQSALRPIAERTQAD
jgi:hypothetical protein